jgi:hypothetical protein
MEPGMRGRSTPRPGGRRDHPERNVQPKEHDPYRRQHKPRDAIVCDRCGVVLHGGRWYWGAPPLCDEKGGLCPACQRIRDRYPAGTIRLARIPEKYREEILRMIHNTEKREKGEHPLERLMGIEQGEGGVVVVTTTGMHLARCIASALQRRFHRGVAIHYAQGESLVHVDWTP